MGEWETESPYQVLGLEQGPGSNEAEIRKAYRLLALKKHPDKNPDNPHAAAEFDRIQKAYDVLTDKAARKALDGLEKCVRIGETLPTIGTWRLYVLY